MEPKDHIDQTQYHSFDNNMNPNQNLNNNISNSEPNKLNSKMDLLNEINLNLIRLRVVEDETSSYIHEIKRHVGFILGIVILIIVLSILISSIIY
ncbi:hypothetical protein [Methanosphaera cuniculi]|uniref:hypothetical protein n=1 Tax=Methanosphaera cuniculi TaxID=1077256 RepID=UPI0026DCDEE9|nr:hypothetical protein [Methanosphaera cuniculi]